MFANYSNLNQDYVPNNTKKDKWLKREFYKDNSYETIDELSNLYHRYKATDEGLEFTYGQEIKFDFDVDDIAYVEKDAIVSYVAGEEPTESTAGNLGQYFYNIADYKVWKCTSLGQTVYRWEQLERFSIPQTNVGQKVKLSEVNDAITCVVFDKRGEIAYQVDIENNSTTIPKEDLERLTERFYRLQSHKNQNIKGTGLGLAIVSQIIKRHRGNMTVQSENNITTFSIYLPISQ